MPPAFRRRPLIGYFVRSIGRSEYNALFEDKTPVGARFAGDEYGVTRLGAAIELEAFQPLHRYLLIIQPIDFFLRVTLHRRDVFGIADNFHAPRDVCFKTVQWHDGQDGTDRLRRACAEHFQRKPEHRGWRGREGRVVGIHNGQLVAVPHIAQYFQDLAVKQRIDSHQHERCSPRSVVWSVFVDFGFFNADFFSGSAVLARSTNETGSR
jgi:hypothetical protein